MIERSDIWIANKEDCVLPPKERMYCFSCEYWMELEPDGNYFCPECHNRTNFKEVIELARLREELQELIEELPPFKSFHVIYLIRKRFGLVLGEK